MTQNIAAISGTSVSASADSAPRPARQLAVILADAILFYVFVYAIGLKRRTASNSVIGSAAGCWHGWR